MKKPPTKLPILATIIVALAVAVMIGLGVWQLQRRVEKEAAIALMAANIGKPPIAFPRPGADLDNYRFRRSSLVCLNAQFVTMVAGKSKAGGTGYRAIMACRTGAEGPGAYVDVGVSKSPSLPSWNGGRVVGTITLKPTSAPLIERLWSKAAPDEPMLVIDVPAAGREASAPPDINDVPNNHLAYAVQWFLFAGIAIIIYLLALRRRSAPPPA